MPEKRNASSGDPPFEKALRELEELTEKMEFSQLDLSELLKNYERGTQLLASCERSLKTARKKIELMQVPVPESDADEPAERSTPPPNDVRLF